MSTNGPITRSDTTSMVSTRPRANRVCVDPGSKFESTNPSSGAIRDVCIEQSLQRYKALEKPGALELSQIIVQADASYHYEAAFQKTFPTGCCGLAGCQSKLWN